jgi:alanyl-tRNA synthetase
VTERLYYADAYLTEFEANVLERADGGRRIYLDRTAFYPTSGGQPFDRGWLGEVEVVEVVDEGERIAHLLASPTDETRVRGRIDWIRRFDHMQQHTGQHLLSAVIADRYGYQTVSVHFGGESSTLDLAGGSLSESGRGGESSGRGELRRCLRRGPAPEADWARGRRAHREHRSARS